MKRIATYFISVLIAGWLPTMAQAADSSVARSLSAPSRGFDWNGLYAGVHGGWAWNNIDGWFAGGQIGFKSQMPGSPGVWGLELDSAFTDIGDSASIAGVTASTKVRYVGTLRGLVGATADRTLFYATGGLAWFNNKVTVSSGGTTLSDNKTHLGWTVGAGVEQAFGGGWSGKIEYLYADFGSENYFGLIPSGDLDIHTIKFGFNYRFGH